MRTKDLIRTPDLNLAFPSAGRRRPYSRQARHARCLPFRVGRLRPFFSPRRAGLRRAHAGGGGGGGHLTELRAGMSTTVLNLHLKRVELFVDAVHSGRLPSG